MRSVRRPARRGTVLPTLGVCLIGLIAFVALAVDLGMLAVSRTESQNAADVAALVGCRNLNNAMPSDAAYDSNRTTAIAAARAVVPNNNHLSTKFTDAQILSITAGVYGYDTDPSSPTYQTFKVSYPAAPPAGQSWTAMKVDLSVSQPTYFMRVFGVTTMPSGASATAVHRPRDVAFVLDMTGSMAYATTFNYSGKSLNPDDLAPAFGHYASVQSSLIASASETNGDGEAISRNNYTIATPGGPPLVRDFLFDPANASSPATSAYPVTSDTASLKNAFHRWSPPESGADATNYVPPTYDFSGYNAYHTGTEASPKGPTPAPDTFGTMTDSASPAITYVGDRWRRANGAINKTNTSWATGSTTTKAATTAIELLGYNVSGSNVRKGTSGSTTITTVDRFRDPVWETYGYDLDVVKYRAWKTSRNSDNPADAATYLNAPTSQGGGGGNVANILVPAADRLQGFSMGPGYWGKTFYVWPPDPRDPAGNPGAAGAVAGDWRQRFFLKADGGAFDTQSDNASGTDFDAINEVLLNSGNGLTLAPVTNTGSPPWQVNYPAVLKWIKSGPQVLPPNLRAGRILYYSSIPDDVNTGTGSTQQRLDKAFWKNYIDYVLGAGTYGYYAYLYGSYGIAFTQLYGYGDNWSAGSRSIYTGDLVTWKGPSNNWSAAYPYMRYNGSPNRPRLHFWFGPLSMMDFIGNGNLNGNWNPGNCHEAQCWQLKAGMNSVLDDIQKNHPNDSVGLVDFAYPGYRTLRVAQGQDFATLKNALFYPKSLLTAIKAGDTTTEIRPYNTSFAASLDADEIPNANGSTDPNTGLAIAFNLLSSSAGLPTGTYGTVKGRRGASKVVIFETDGVPNSYSGTTFTKKGYDSYYSAIGNGASNGNGDATSMTNAVNVVKQMVKLTATANTSNLDSGLSLSNAPAKVYPIGFGDLFDTTLAPNATFRNTAKQFLANIGVAGNTLPAGSTSPPTTQLITGAYQNRIDTLKTCLERIFQSGVSVTLIE